VVVDKKVKKVKKGERRREGSKFVYYKEGEKEASLFITTVKLFILL